MPVANSSLPVAKPLKPKPNGLGKGAAVAKVLHIFEDHPQLGNGYLMEALSGESLAPKILKYERFQTARDNLTRQCAQSLVHIHQTPIDQLSFLPLQDAATQLADLKQLHKSFGEALPVFSLAFHWLANHFLPAHNRHWCTGIFVWETFWLPKMGSTAFWTGSSLTWATLWNTWVGLLPRLAFFATGQCRGWLRQAWRTIPTVQPIIGH